MFNASADGPNIPFILNYESAVGLERSHKLTTAQPCLQAYIDGSSPVPMSTVV